MSRYWRILKFGAFGLGGLFGLGLIWLAVANAQANEKLEEKLAALKAAGEPISLAELARKPIPPETNAATFLNRAQDGMQAIEKPMSADFDDEADFYNGKPGGKYYQLAKDTLAANPEVVPLLEQAAACPDFDPQLNYQLETTIFLEKEMLPNFGRKRSAVRILNYQAHLNLCDGHPEKAFEQCLAMLRLARLFENDPLLVNHLVVQAVRGVALSATDRVLRSGSLKPQMHDALEEELTRLDPAKAFQYVLRTDRAYGIDSFAELGSPLVGYMKLPSGKNDESSYLDLFAAMIADGPRLKPSEAVEKILAESGPLTRLMAPIVYAVGETNTRTVANVRAIRLLNALLRGGRTAEQPDFKALNLPEEVLVDPYNLKPLVVTRQPNGWLIYSVGKDLKDDGGKVQDHTDVGFGP